MSLLDPELPDAEALLSQFLRAQDEIQDAVDDRVYTAIPQKATFPLVRLTRVAGVPIVDDPLVLDHPLLQVEAYGGSKQFARELCELVRRVIAARIKGVHDDLGIVTGHRFGSMSYLPDDAYTPGTPRYIADVELFTRPLRTLGS